MADSGSPGRVLWRPPNPAKTRMHAFKIYLERQTSQSFPTYAALLSYSTTHISDFWRYLFTFLPIIYTGSIPAVVYDANARIDTIPRPPWFRGVSINFAENILFTGDGRRSRTTKHKHDSKTAVIQVREGGFMSTIDKTPVTSVTWGDLRRRVGRLSNAMRARGLRKGDRVAVVASTSIDTLVVFLATAALGGVFSSSSTDMGTKGILDRLLQIRPRWVFVDDEAVYNGKQVDLRTKMAEICEGMRGVSEFKGLVVQRRDAEQKVRDLSRVKQAAERADVWVWDEFVDAAQGDAELRFEKTGFNDELLIVYSSGTTGQPKCIVHCVGGLVLNGYKEKGLHSEMDENSVNLQYTTTGWIMYLASVQALFLGTTMVAYDGSPFLPKPQAFLEVLARLKVTHLGTSPRYLQTLQQNEIVPKKEVDLSALRVVSTTGMVLSEALFEWFYDVGFPKTARIDNISGGTDLAGCFAGGSPIEPLYAGGCQAVGLGMSVKVFDSSLEPTDEELRTGKPMRGRESVTPGEPGELVCDNPFPMMPLYFFGDTAGKKYFASYFEKFDNVWTHGDFISIHPQTGQVFFMGRADGVLNPSGVRFGSSEIYSVIEKHFADRISDTVCVGQRRPQDTDEKVLLFVLMKDGHRFTKTLIKEVKARIAEETSKRHVPALIFETKEIPTTVNGKKVELPVKQIVCGKTVKPSGTLANPQSLDFYYQFAQDENLKEIDQAKL